MPVTSREKRITQEPEGSTPDPSSPTLPSQQEFHLHLRTLAEAGRSQGDRNGDDRGIRRVDWSSLGRV